MEQKKVPWNGWVALIYGVVLFFVAQIIGGLAAAMYGALQGWSVQKTTDWLQSAVAGQFAYILIAEVLTVAGIFAFIRFYKQPLNIIGFKRPRWDDLFAGLMGFPIYFVLFAIMLAIASQVFPGLDVNQEQQIGFKDVAGTWPLIMTFISLVILPPLTEEILLRGFLYTSLRKYFKFGLAALIVSAIFAAAHLPEGGDAGPLWVGAIDTFMLSLVLCYVREKTGSLWGGIVIHALKNCLAFILLFIIQVR